MKYQIGTPFHQCDAVPDAYPRTNHRSSSPPHERVPYDCDSPHRAGLALHRKEGGTVSDRTEGRLSWRWL